MFHDREEDMGIKPLATMTACAGCWILVSGPVAIAGEECNVTGVYTAVDLSLEGFAKIQDSFGSWHDATFAKGLRKANVKSGLYAVTITGEEDDMFEIDGGPLYVQTSYCHRYSTWNDDAVLNVRVRGYGAVGTLTWTE